MTEAALKGKSLFELTVPEGLSPSCLGGTVVGREEGWSRKLSAHILSCKPEPDKANGK